jgi:hypothetical protein
MHVHDLLIQNSSDELYMWLLAGILPTLLYVVMYYCRWGPEAQDPPQIRPTTWLILDRCFICHVTLLIRDLSMHFLSEDN